MVHDSNMSSCAANTSNPQSAIQNPHSPISPSPHLPLSPSSVLLLTAEDDLADTVRPRLEALGADCDKILAISSVPGENANDVPRAFALNRDLARLKILLRAIPDCRLLVIDPVSAYLGGANEQANADVQSVLTALATLVRDRELAVIIVSHLRKKEGAAIYRTMGSLAFVAAARAAWIVCKDPADPNNRFLLPLKNNLAPDVTGLAFTVEASGETRTPVIRWSPEPMNLSVDTHFASVRATGRPDDERQHTIEWLRERLSNGSRATRDLRDEAEANGISYGTLRRAFRALGAEAKRVGPFPFGEWHWKLPGVDAAKCRGGVLRIVRIFPIFFPTSSNRGCRHQRQQFHHPLTPETRSKTRRGEHLTPAPIGL